MSDYEETAKGGEQQCSHTEAQPGDPGLPDKIDWFIDSMIVSQAITKNTNSSTYNKSTTSYFIW